MAAPQKHKLTPEQEEEFLFDWKAAVLSIREIGVKFGMPESTVRQRCAGILREGAETKRSIVRAAQAGIQNPEVEERLKDSIGVEASEDIRIGKIVASTQVKIIEFVRDEMSKKPKTWEIPILGGAQRSAYETYRKVRELDDPNSGKMDPFAFIKSNRENELGA